MNDFAKTYPFVGKVVCTKPTSYELYCWGGDTKGYEVGKEYYLFSDGGGGNFVKSVKDPHMEHRVYTEISLFFFQDELDTCFKPVTD